MNSEGRKELAIKVAKMYYINGESQEKIAELTGMSRSNISRILKKCLDEGIVEITVHDTISVRMKLAHSIQTAFGLKEVIIVHSAPAPDRIYRNVGQSLSVYLMKILKDGMTLGVGRGRASYYIGRNL
ncbi:sugar-binding domain-containing protein, partial [Enterocloster lavalensis]